MGFEIVAKVVRVCLSRDTSAAAAWFCIVFANTNIHVPALTIRKCKYSHTHTHTHKNEPFVQDTNRESRCLFGDV